MTERFKQLKQLLSYGSTSNECFSHRCTDNVIIRGATKIQTFRLPFKFNIARKIFITYVQDGFVILRKEIGKSDLIDGNNLISFILTEDETLRFKSDKEALVQVKAKLLDNDIITSELFSLKIDDSLDASRMALSDGSIIAAELNVNSEKLDAIQFNDIVTGNNVYKCLFYFDSSWDNFSRTYIFKDEYNDSEILETNGDTVTIPRSVLRRPGKIYVKVCGTYGNLVKGTELSNALEVEGHACLEK